MPENEQDPARNTQEFRAFAKESAEPARSGANTGLIIGVVAAVLVIIIAVALLVD